MNVFYTVGKILVSFVIYLCYDSIAWVQKHIELKYLLGIELKKTGACAFNLIPNTYYKLFVSQSM